MTRTGRAKTVTGTFGTDRLKLARSFLKAARSEVLLAEPEDIGNPPMSPIVNAAIAYTDALTAKYAERATNKIMSRPCLPYATPSAIVCQARKKPIFVGFWA
ncbi:hypothetical protein [Acidisphaera sp. S103]|uniref:hypothetical protein n=1 Tax=Acidisphaera sp. S103 TaxID=1747223 RepID=UPI001C202C70|nr:hypothetical protein [Acidisphaera sp. S103]